MRRRINKIKHTRTHLVAEHLEGLSRKVLEKYRPIIRDYVKGKNGIYALYRGKEIYYVGLASNLRNRLHHHLNDRHASSWDTFNVYLTKSDRHLRELESLLLRVIGPKGNRRPGRLPGSRDLKKSLGTDISHFMQQELRELVGGTKKVRTIGKTRARGRKREPVPLQPYVARRFGIRRRYKGQLYKATVRKTGKISFRNRVYTTPSAAAVAVTKRPTNGWSFWRYKSNEGEWVKLNRLKR